MTERRQLQITRYGAPEVLKVVSTPIPPVGDDDALVQVEFAGLNFADIGARMGLYPDAPKPPMTVGYEASGTIAAVGKNVKSIQPGARVIAMTQFQGHSSHIVVPARQVMPLPANMTMEEGAALPVNYLTAYHSLIRVANVQKGAHVLIHAAAGGVGQASLQVLKSIENVTLYGTASPAKHARLKEAGFHHCIDYTTQDFEKEIARLTNGRGVDIVLDAVGGASWKKSYNSLAKVGHLVCFGWSAMIQSEKRNFLRVAIELLKKPSFSPIALMSDNRAVSGINLGQMWSEHAVLAGHLEMLTRLFEKGFVKPHIDKIFKLDEGAQAHEYIQSRKSFGKVLLDCR